MIANSAQHAMLDPRFRAPARADIFTDLQGMTQSISRILQAERDDQWRIMYEYAGWNIVTTIRQEADHRFCEIETQQEEYRRV